MNNLKISAPNLILINDELNFIIKNMRESPDLLKKLFYYSGVPLIFNRILNAEYHPLLVHLHMIFQVSHNTINNQVREIAFHNEVVIKIPEKYFEKLESALDELNKNIKNGKDVCQSLQRITNITYALLGNGYYLLQKGYPLL